MGGVMQIVKDFPPLYDEMCSSLNCRGKSVIFAWGDRIYNPHGGPVHPALVAHEAVHGERQGSDIIGWWRRYMAEPAFRLAEEVPAHQAEFKALSGAGNRHMRRAALKVVADRLSGPLYGGLVSPAHAKLIINSVWRAGAAHG